MLLYIILIIVGFALLIVGADFLVDGASEIAKRFHIPEIVIGLTILYVILVQIVKKRYIKKVGSWL